MFPSHRCAVRLIRDDRRLRRSRSHTCAGVRARCGGAGAHARSRNHIRDARCLRRSRATVSSCASTGRLSRLRRSENGVHGILLFHHNIIWVPIDDTVSTRIPLASIDRADADLSSVSISDFWYVATVRSAAQRLCTEDLRAAVVRQRTRFIGR